MNDFENNNSTGEDSQNSNEQSGFDAYNTQNDNPFTQQAALSSAPAPSSGLATASLVLGIISLVVGIFMLAFAPLFIIPILGIIFGIVHKSKHLPVGKGASTAGIVTSVISLVFCIALIVIVVVFILNGSDEMNQFMYGYMEQLKETNPDQYDQMYDQLYEQFPAWFDGAVKMFMCLIGK